MTISLGSASPCVFYMKFAVVSHKFASKAAWGRYIWTVVLGEKGKQ